MMGIGERYISLMLCVYLCCSARHVAAMWAMWVLCITKSCVLDNRYYFNRETGESQWAEDVGATVSAKPPPPGTPMTLAAFRSDESLERNRRGVPTPTNIRSARFPRCGEEKRFERDTERFMFCSLQ